MGARLIPVLFPGVGPKNVLDQLKFIDNVYNIQEERNRLVDQVCFAMTKTTTPEQPASQYAVSQKTHLHDYLEIEIPLKLTVNHVRKNTHPFL